MFGFSSCQRSTQIYVLGRLGSLLAAALLLAAMWHGASLTPRVDESFFFGNDDPQLQEDAKIYKLFPRQDQLIINIEGKTNSVRYLDKISRLTKNLLAIPEIVSAKSLSHGPKNFDDALTSEFWGRLLIPEDRKSSNIFVALDARAPQQAIRNVEAAVRQSEAEDFRPVITGIPYMIELIRRKLVLDLQVFSLTAVGIFGLMTFVIFRSLSILIGCLTASAAATALTFLIGELLAVEIGILTANLVTIVFVLTIAHIVYLTYNWKRLSREASTRGRSIKNALWETFPGSIWSTGTTLLGFLSLLLVQAKPLRQLGASGAIGTVCALLAAYLIYPWFLVGTKTRTAASGVTDGGKRDFVLARYSVWITLAFVGVCLVLGLGIFRLNADPSLLSYFPEDLRSGLERVDRAGGSSIMEIVLRDARGQKLDHNESYERLSRLQRDLERDREIGSVISLPLLMAEGDDFPFSFLFSWKTILKKMAEPRYEGIGRQFISHDHLYGHYILRMKESGRQLPRTEVIQRTKETIRRHGFNPVLVGGMYPLQAQLSQLVESSLIQGLGELVLLLGVIGLIVTRSLWIAVTMASGMALVPIGLLGLIGFLKAPLDIISAPAANLTLGLGIDDTMIHLAQRWKSLVRQGHAHDEAWEIARRQLWRPILVSMLIVCAGFTIFILSEFPPTRRFGLWVVIGTLLVLPSALCFLPTVASIWARRKARQSRKKQDERRKEGFRRARRHK
jgi:predicted RND superfamily exporter protein